MLLLEDVPVRWRTLLARRQFLDRHADTIAVAKRGEAEVSVAHGKARHVGPLRPRDVGGGVGPGWRDSLRRHRRATSLTERPDATCPAPSEPAIFGQDGATCKGDLLSVRGVTT